MSDAPEEARPERTPIRLLYVSTVASTIRDFLIPYAAHFRAKGWHVSAAANGTTADPAFHGTFDDVFELPLSRSIRDIRELAAGARAVSTVVRRGYDIVHVHSPIAAFVTRRAIAGLPLHARPKVAYTAHGFHFHRGGHPLANRAFIAAERIAGRWTDRLIVMNDEDHASALAHRLVVAQKLIRMPGIGVDTDFYSRSRITASQMAEMRRSLSLPDHAEYFVVIAELSKRKRVSDVVDAIGRMTHNDTMLAIAGIGPERDRLVSHAIKLGVNDRVRFVGQLRDVRPLVAGAVALVLASDREGLARAIMEALALEIPVIASAARGNEELVDSESGFVIPVGDREALASRMDWMLDHPDLRTAMGSRGRSRMVKQYDLSILLQMHEQMYEEMLQAARSP
jgi:glycosyltransferase involved in cell wall biosynthesis